LARAAEGPAIASERFAGGETIVAEHHGEPAGFVLLQPLDGLLCVTNVAVIPTAAGLGIGRLLIIGAEHRAQQLEVAGLSLTTFRTPPWNGPWFRRQGYSPIPAERIGPGLPGNFGSSCNLSRHGDARDSVEAARRQSAADWRWVGEANEGPFSWFVTMATLIVFGGLSGSGKPSIARELARDTGAMWLRIDSIEQAIRESGIGPDR
jgi:N-acetylglutamate synthase-like GNAT family acetyltransferase